MKALPLACLVFCFVFSAAAQAADASEKIFELEILRSAPPEKPRVLRVEKDDSVRIRVRSEVTGEIHLHGYRLEMKLAPGSPRELAFKARATGRYRVEWHPAGEAASKGDPHGPPLALLEVHPK
jgi:hypothetical protein